MGSRKDKKHMELGHKPPSKKMIFMDQNAKYPINILIQKKLKFDRKAEILYLRLKDLEGKGYLGAYYNAVIKMATQWKNSMDRHMDKVKLYEELISIKAASQKN